MGKETSRAKFNKVSLKKGTELWVVMRQDYRENFAQGGGKTDNEADH